MKPSFPQAQIDPLARAALPGPQSLQPPGNHNLPAANFNRIARFYLWLEYLAFGSILQQTRTCLLHTIHDRRRALLFGDGDGRFLARLFAQNPLLTADAIDTSTTMLHLLRRRVEPLPPALAGPSRLRTHPLDALAFLPDHPPDLVVTHFFLDCLTQPQVDRLIDRLTPSLAPDAVWLISEFRIPPGPLAFPARLFVRALYFAFRLLTGLRVTRLPAHHRALHRAGFLRIAHRHRLFGLLIAERWQRQPDATKRELGYPHT